MSHVYTREEAAKMAEEMAAAKSAASLPSLVLLGLAAGAYIAFGGGLAFLVSNGLGAAAEGNPALVRLVSGALFPLGLILIVLVGGELFTGNVAYMTVGIVRGRVTWAQLLWNWLLIWCANFLGALLVTYLLFKVGFGSTGGLFSAEPWAAAAAAVGEAKVSMPWGEAFVRGIGANWLVCLALWLGNASDSMAGRLAGLWWPVMTFVVFGFEHSIANMFYLPMSLLEGGDFTVAEMLLRNLLPVTLGNIVGGALFVGLPYAFVTKAKKQ